MKQRRTDFDFLLGKTVRGVARLAYERAGVIDPTDGALEIDLADHVLLLDGAPDGERLCVRDGSWKDPFAGPLSPENQAFVERHGRWRRVDRSRDSPYSELVGKVLIDLRPLENVHQRVAGIRLSVSGRSLWFVVEGDECHVRWVHPIGFSEVLI